VDGRLAEPFSIRKALARYGASGLTDYRRLPWAGDEKGDRGELERFMVGTFPLTVGEVTTITAEFRLGDPWLTMGLQLRGELLGGSVTPTGTINGWGANVLWQIAMQTDLDGYIIEPFVSMRALSNYQALAVEAATSGAVNPTVPGIGAVTTFAGGSTIFFVDPLLRNQEDSILDTRRYAKITLQIKSGTLADLINPSTNITMQNLMAEISLLRVSPRVPLPPGVAKVLNHYKSYPRVLPLNGQTVLSLDKIPTLAIKRIMFFNTAVDATDTQWSGDAVGTILDTLRIVSNKRVHLGSDVGGVTRRILFNENTSDYHISLGNAIQVFDACLDKSLLSALPTGDLSRLDAEFTYQTPIPAVASIWTLQNGVQKLRGTRGT
jgi:hypothetical protein